MKTLLILFGFPLVLVAGIEFPIKGKSIDGKEIKFEVNTSNYGVIVFLSSNCPCSQSHEEKLAKYAQDFKNVPFLAILSNAEEETDSILKHFKNSPIHFPILDDRNQFFLNRFKAVKTPHAFIVDKDGNFLYQGGIDNSTNAKEAKIDFLLDALENLKADQEIKVKLGRTLGCSITRKKND